MKQRINKKYFSGKHNFINDDNDYDENYKPCEKNN